MIAFQTWFFSFLVLGLISTAFFATAAVAQEPPPPMPTELPSDPIEPGDPVVEGDEGAGEGEAEAEEPARDRVSFQFQLADGGRVEGSAGEFEYQEERYLIATGGVEIRYRDIELEAERARIDIPTSLLTAEGDVMLDEGPQRLTGDALEYDLDTRTGTVTHATAYVDPDYYFSGDRIAKVGERTFTVDDGVFTACEGEVPSWSIHLGSARITLDEYAHIRNAQLKLKRAPIFYLPYIVWPATTERSSGFLVPKPGYSKRRGASLDLAYYRTLGRSADATFLFDVASESYFGFGNEVRYRPSAGTEGFFRLYAVSEPDDVPLSELNRLFDPDREPGDLRWKVELFHKSDDLWNNFRAAVAIQEYSDFDYLQDYERSVDRQTRSFVYSNAYLTRNVGQHSFNVLVDQRERLLTGDRTDIRRQLPEVEYRLRPTQLGRTPIYFSLASSMHYFSIDQNQLNEQYGRAHVAPTFSIPVSTLPWLSAKLNLGGRATFYTETLVADDEGMVQFPSAFGGGSLTRVVPDAGLEAVGPVFSRIFDKELGRFAKLKHVIEPRVTYGYVDEFDEQEQIFRFDEIDGLNPTNGFVFSLTNRLLAKPSDPDEGGAVEIASFEVRQSLSLEDERPGQGVFGGESTREGPLFMTLRVNPSRKTSVKTDLRYSTLFNDFQSLAFTGEKRFGGGSPLGDSRLGLTLFTNWNPRTGERTSDQVRLFTRLPLVPRRLTFDAAVSYDLVRSELLQQRYFLNWHDECYGWQLELRESTFGTIENRDLRFSFTLKNVGTFLDLNESL